MGIEPFFFLVNGMQNNNAGKVSLRKKRTS